MDALTGLLGATPEQLQQLITTDQAINPAPDDEEDTTDDDE